MVENTGLAERGSLMRKEKLKGKRPKYEGRKKKMKKQMESELYNIKRELGVGGGGRDGGRQMEREKNQRTKKYNCVSGNKKQYYSDKVISS